MVEPVFSSWFVSIFFHFPVIFLGYLDECITCVFGTSQGACGIRIKLKDLIDLLKHFVGNINFYGVLIYFLEINECILIFFFCFSSLSITDKEVQTIR